MTTKQTSHLPSPSSEPSPPPEYHVIVLLVDDHELTDLFFDGAPKHIAGINQHINDPPNLALHAHSLKSISLNLGAKRMVQLAGKLEEMGNGGILVGAPHVSSELETVFNQTKDKLLSLREK